MQTFSKKDRLTTKQEYNSVFANAKKVDEGELFALIRPNNEDRARLGLCISKKSCPKACERNRIKRLIRESFRQHSLPKVDVVLLGRKGVVKLSNKRITEKLMRLWEQLSA